MRTEPILAGHFLQCPLLQRDQFCNLSAAGRRGPSRSSGAAGVPIGTSSVRGLRKGKQTTGSAKRVISGTGGGSKLQINAETTFYRGQKKPCYLRRDLSRITGRFAEEAVGPSSA